MYLAHRSLTVNFHDIFLDSLFVLWQIPELTLTELRILMESEKLLPCLGQ